MVSAGGRAGVKSLHNCVEGCLEDNPAELTEEETTYMLSLDCEPLFSQVGECSE